MPSLELYWVNISGGSLDLPDVGVFGVANGVETLLPRVEWEDWAASVDVDTAIDAADIAFRYTSGGANITGDDAKAAVRTRTAQQVAFVPTTNITDTNVQDAIQSAAGQGIGDISGFEAFADPTTRSTTTNGWTTATTFLTSEAKDTGQYYLGWSLDIGQSDKEKDVGVRLRSRNQGGSYTVRRSTITSVGIDNGYNLYSGFDIFDITTGGANHQIQVQFGQTDEGGTGRIREINVIFYKVRDL